MQRRIAIVLVALVAGALVGAATASDPGQVYHACVNNSSGAIFIVSGPEDCTNNETYVDWNQIGAEGPAGPQGDPGPQGPQGDPGPPGDVEVYLLTQTHLVLPYHEIRLSVGCDEDDQIISGGYQFAADIPLHEITVWESRPDFLEQSWKVVLSNPTTAYVDLTAYAICHNATP